MAPAVDFNGKIYLESKDMPALSPNGNGGWFSSLRRAGLCSELHKRGIEWINIYAVDNVLQRIADPVFVGATILSGVNCGAKVVLKASPEERVGVLCLEDSSPAIIEYYELTKEMAEQRAENGSLSYRYGVILNYLFRLSKLEETADRHIPVHIVRKKIEYVDEKGNVCKPETENGKKFETLAVDLIKPMESVLPFVVEREKEFAAEKKRSEFIMATDLVGNEKLQRFIQLLSDLNHETAEAFSTGKTELLHKMNDTILEMYAIQQKGTEEAYTAIEEDCQIIYRNFNAIIAMLKSNESVFFDTATSVAVKKFLRNVFDANISILTAYGLV